MQNGPANLSNAPQSIADYRRCSRLSANNYISTFLFILLDTSSPTILDNKTIVATTETVILYGPTGAVGGAAAVEACQRGAHVWLAMRSTSKEIQGFDSNAEVYSHVEADLPKPESLKGAVSKSGAKTAFAYANFQSSYSMRASFQTLKDVGITYVVMLSSFTVHGDARGD